MAPGRTTRFSRWRPTLEDDGDLRALAGVEFTSNSALAFSVSERAISAPSLPRLGPCLALRQADAVIGDNDAAAVAI